MEARRRLTLLYSHLRPIDLGPPSSSLALERVPISANPGGADDDDSHSSEQEKRECIFCKIISGESPAFKIYEDDVCLCILDLNPLTHGHSLVIPRQHYSSLKATPPSIVASMCSKVPFVSNAIMKATNSDSFNLLVNSGAAAGQVIFHTHFHIIPRKAHDRLWKSESFKRKPLDLDQETAQLANSIREKLSTNENCEHGKGHGTSSS